MTEPTASLRVAKKFMPDQRGALKLARRYGPDLVCVRHRYDDAGLYRVTTIELVVERTPVSSRSDRTVGVRIGADEKALQTLVKGRGAKWDAEARVWRMPQRTAAALGLQDRVVAKGTQ